MSPKWRPTSIFWAAPSPLHFPPRSCTSSCPNSTRKQMNRLQVSAKPQAIMSLLRVRHSLRKTLISYWIFDPRFFETLQSQPAAIASAAPSPFVIRFVAAQRQAVVNTQAHAFANDLRLGFLEQGSVDSKCALAFHRRLGREIGQPLELTQELRPAIGIAGIINRVSPDENVEGRKRLRIS